MKSTESGHLEHKNDMKQSEIQNTEPGTQAVNSPANDASDESCSDPQEIPTEAADKATSASSNRENVCNIESSSHAPAASKSEQPKQEQPVSRHTVQSDFSHTFLALAIMLCFSILIGCGYCVYNLAHTKSLEGQLRRARSDDKTAETTIDDLNTQLSDLRTRLETAEGENDTLSDQVDTLNDQVTSLEADVSQYKYDASSARKDADYAAGQIDTLNDTVTGLENDLATAKDENDTLQDENDTLRDENDTLQDENDALQDENDTLTAENEANSEKISFYDSHIVFVNVGDSNKYYHTYDCPDFTKKSFLAYNVKLAVQNGYSPCPVCHASGTTTTGTTTTTTTTTN